MENKKIATSAIIYGAILAIVGIVTMVLAFVNVGVIDKVISYSLAVCFFLLGVTMIVASIVSNVKELFNMTLIVGSVCIAIGLVLCIEPSLITGFLILFIGALLLSLGVVSLAKFIIAIVHKEKASIIVTLGVAAALTITIGVLAIVFRGNTPVVLYAGLGAILIIVGVAAIVRSAKVLHDAKKAMKAAGPVDAK